jgi:hypothetical protein
MTRRWLLGTAWIVLVAASALALPEEKKVLEVTYYYLPG